MTRRQSNNPEASGTLNEYRDEEGNLDGIQFYLEDERQFSDLLLDWMIGNGYVMDHMDAFLDSMGLKAHITEAQWQSMLCGVAVPGQRLAALLSEPVSKTLGITATKVINRAAIARRDNLGADVVEVSASARLEQPKSTATQRVREAQKSQKSEFGQLLRAYMDRASHTYASLSAALREHDPKAGNHISSWIGGTRRPRPLSMGLLKPCLNLSDEEHEQLIVSSWKEHLTLWQKALRKASQQRSFGAMFKAHYKSRFCDETLSPYTYESLSAALGVSSKKIQNLERNITLPDASLFDAICQTLRLSDQEVSELAEAVAYTTRTKHAPESELGELSQKLLDDESLGAYTTLAKLYRARTGLSVEEMVQTLGVKRELINFLEQGKRIARPETRQQLKSYLHTLKVPPDLQDRIVYAMDYTNLDIASKQAQLTKELEAEQYDFPKIFRLCRETSLKQDGGVGLISYREAADALKAQGGDISQGTIRNWELSIGQPRTDAKGKAVRIADVKPYMDMIEVPDKVQVALIELLAQEQQSRIMRRKEQAGVQADLPGDPDTKVSHSEPLGPVVTSGQARTRR